MAHANPTLKVTLDTNELQNALKAAWALGVRRGFYSQPLFTLEQALEDCPFDAWLTPDEEI